MQGLIPNLTLNKIALAQSSQYGQKLQHNRNEEVNSLGAVIVEASVLGEKRISLLMTICRCLKIPYFLDYIQSGVQKLSLFSHAENQQSIGDEAEISSQPAPFVG